MLKVCKFFGVVFFGQPLGKSEYKCRDRGILLNVQKRQIWKNCGDPVRVPAAARRFPNDIKDLDPGGRGYHR